MPSDLHQRLVALINTSGALLGFSDMPDVLPAIVKVAAGAVSADGYALWRLNRARNVWEVASHAGVSSEFANAVIATHEGRAVTPLASAAPITAEDVESVPMLEERRDAYRREGVRSMLAIPLVTNSGADATLVFYYRERHTFPADELEIASAVGNLASAAIRTADLHAARRRHEQEALFLAQAAAALGSSLDYQQTLKTLAGLAVPHIADWCAVDMVRPDGHLDRLAVAHRDPARIALAHDFLRRYPPDPNASTGVYAVIRTGRPQVLEDLTEDMIAAGARSEEHRQAVLALGVRSFMIVPLRTRQGIAGAITFVGAESGRHYKRDDLQFAETVADRAAVAIENAWAYDQLRTANQLKDEFLATLSHELRTPLNAILGYASMLRTGALAPERRESALETIERNAAALTQMVGDILDVSRIISGKLRLAIGDLEVARTVRDAVSTIAPAAAAKQIDVRWSVAERTPSLAGDPERIQQVLWNLLNNAVKFTPADGSVTITAASVPPNVEIVVRDTGRGIDPAFLPFVFERFRQGDAGINREYGGLGLGLSIARHIVEMHGGTIDVESDGPGCGAAFRVRLPAAPARQRSTTPIAQHA